MKKTFENFSRLYIIEETSVCSEAYSSCLKRRPFFELYLRNYYTDSQGKKYRYNLDINNRKFCENNIIIDEIGQVAKFDGSMFMVIDNYVFDFMTPYIYDHFDEYNRDAFIRSLGVVTKMTIKKSENKNKKIIISTQKGKDIVLVIDKHNALIEYHNSNLKKVPDGFLQQDAPQGTAQRAVGRALLVLTALPLSLRGGLAYCRLAAAICFSSLPSAAPDRWLYPSHANCVPVLRQSSAGYTAYPASIAPEFRPDRAIHR